MMTASTVNVIGAEPEMKWRFACLQWLADSSLKCNDVLMRV